MKYPNTTPLTEDETKENTEKIEVEGKEVDKTPKSKSKSPVSKDVANDPSPKLGETEKADDGESLEVYVDDPSLLELDADLTGVDQPIPGLGPDPEVDASSKAKEEAKVEEDHVKEDKQATSDDKEDAKGSEKDDKSSVKENGKTDSKLGDKPDDKSSSSEKKSPSNSSSSTRRRFVYL